MCLLRRTSPWRGSKEGRALLATDGDYGTVLVPDRPGRRRAVIGLYKTELIKPRGPWRTVEQVELATLDYVDWYNHRRLFETGGDIPPAELEAAYYRQNTSLAEAG